MIHNFLPDRSKQCSLRLHISELNFLKYLAKQIKIALDQTTTVLILSFFDDSTFLKILFFQN